MPAALPACLPAHICLLLQILKGDLSLKDSSVTESGFCVVMIMKVGAAEWWVLQSGGCGVVR